MARPLRIEFDGAFYHVTARGNDKKRIFLDDEDRDLFLDILAGVNHKYNWLCHAYCLMNNHYHLVIETPDGNLSKGMRQLNGVYTQAFNKRHSRVGHIFQGRFKAIIVDRESYLLEVCRYVVLNPVRARAVKKPGEWKWSGYRGTAGIEAAHECLTTDWLLGQFGTIRTVARRKYAEFIDGGIAESAMWDEVKGQIVLGGESFAEKILEYVGDGEGIREIPKAQRLLTRPALAGLFAKMTKKDIIKRNEIIREAVQKHGYSQSEISSHLGLHYTTISRIINES
jgi:REP element-mobilizing transposase RayT